MDYQQIGFNQYLQKVDSIPAQDRGFISNTEADSVFEGLGAALITQGAVTQELVIRSKGRVLVYNGTVPEILIGFDEGGF